VDPELIAARKADYDGVVRRIRESFFGQEHYFIPKSALEATPEEREREFDRMWDAGGFAFWLGNYRDMFFSQEANDLCADYLRRKIRKTVKTRSWPRSSYPRVTPTAPSGSRWTPTTTRPSTRTTCCWSTPRPTARSRRSPRGASELAARNTNSTS
jgi:hypothetical protein